MPRKISTLLKTTTTALDKKGAFDGFVDIDSLLHVDPSLLATCKVAEFKSAHEKFEKYFIRRNSKAAVST